MSLKIFLLSAVVCSGHVLLGQDNNRFKNFHGLRQPGSNAEFFEAEGYEIFTQIVDYGLDEKGISKIKKKYSIKDIPITYDSILQLRVFRKTEEKFGVIGYYAYYLIPDPNKNTSVVGFIRVASQDIGLERDFVKSYVSKRIPAFIYTSLVIDSIDFVGRTIQLGPICHWMAPHNIQCPDKGQMNWAIFDNLKQAEEYRDAEMEMAKNKGIINFQEQKWINLKFEGQETKALVVKAKVQLPKLVMGGSNILIVYYVTGQVRGKFVTCVLSHYTDDVNAETLPPLLAEVLELTE